MKRTIISVIILICILILSVSSGIYIRREIAAVSALLSQTLDAVASGNDMVATDLAKKAGTKWRAFYKHRMFFVDVEHVSGVNACMARIAALSPTDEDFPVECEVAITVMEIFSRKQDLNIYNIL